MNDYYLERDIDLGDTRVTGGHEVFTKATWKDRPVIYKKNKHGKALLSQMEVGFTSLAQLFLMENLTAEQKLVKNEKGAIVGVACSHITEVIQQREGESRHYYTFQNNQLGQAKLGETPFYFLNQFPPGLINEFIYKSEPGKGRPAEFEIDYDSLASVLTASYTLEEDDLHKGNFGFYIVHGETKPRVTFFKIDHDLMLADSIMSRLSTRFFNWFNTKRSFECTRRDILTFPLLRDSANYYWPTTRRGICYLGKSKKAYLQDEELFAFASLADKPEFIACKWREFYRHILIPPELIQKNLKERFSSTVPQDNANLHLITQAVVARQAQLRATLFSIPEFRNFVKDQSPDEMITRMFGRLDGEYVAEIRATIEKQQSLLNQFNEKDTPLHAAIRLGDYRYHETWSAFSEYANQKNTLEQTPLDIAILMAKEQKKPSPDPRQNLTTTMQHMLRSGAEKTPLYTRYPLSSTPLGYLTENNPYLQKVQEGVPIRKVLQAIGEDHRYCLKMQKEMALLCLNHYLQRCSQENDPKSARVELLALKKDLNDNRGNSADSFPLQYIRQLRSELWIVRVIRGLFGRSSTLCHMNQCIATALKKLPAATPKASFFATHSSSPAKPADEPDQSPHPL